MPPLTNERLAIHLNPGAVRAVRHGHPWVFNNSIVKQNREGSAGALGVLFDEKREFVGIGLYDPNSPIRVRVLHGGGPVEINDRWLHDKLAESLARRTTLRDDPGTDGYRLVHGENDGLPGLVVDRYADTLVVKLDTGAWAPYLRLITDFLQELAPHERLVLRLSRSVRTEHRDASILCGPPLDGPVLFRENGLIFESDPLHGQKTGFFLDQRDNRARVETLSKGRNVLNVFAYTGGFSLYAARGGAKSVTSLDVSAPALEAATRNFAHNPELARVPHDCLCADAFVALDELAGQGDRFDMVILDPPSFTRKQTDVEQALVTYERLADLGLNLLARGGILVAASCSARVSADDFFFAVQQAASGARRSLRELERTGHALDHPVGFLEGAYLKCLFARAVD